MCAEGDAGTRDAKQQTHLGADLVAALAGLNVDNFTHRSGEVLLPRRLPRQKADRITRIIAQEEKDESLG